MSLPCKTLAKASSLPLNPGDGVYFRRGDSWVGRLLVSRSGVSGSNIIVGAYGSGARPRITGGTEWCVNLRGSRITLDNLETSACGWSGVKVDGDNVIVKYMSITGNVAGMYITATADNGLYENNVLVNNNRMSADKSGANDDSGAFGFLIHGNGNELRWNEVRGSDAPSPDYGRDGAAFEIYGASNTIVHHNISINNDAFTELGKAPEDTTADNNRFEYNAIYSDEAEGVDPKPGSQAKALVTRAGSDYGPVTNTRFRNNSVRLTGQGSANGKVTAITCYGGCTSGHLELRTNAVQVSGTNSTTGWVDTGFSNSNFNVFFPALPQGLTKGDFDTVANPTFTSPTNLRLRDIDSPAVDRGCTTYWTFDLDRKKVPTDILGRENGPACTDEPDAGAYEFVPAATSGTSVTQ
ncbi:MAG: right-handed parallel beta-helix repeat-containing protein [Actinobacteria bacterium]|nr:right-handed parallel beta-helix repeat-containing protein [Actinomycetota bacterium]